MKRSTMVVMTFSLVMIGTMVLMQHLPAQQPAPDVQPRFTSKSADIQHVVVHQDVLIPAGENEKDYTLAQQAMELLNRYGSTEDSQQREEIQAELQKVVSEQFEVRQQARQKELEQLEAQVQRLRNIHKRRGQEKESIITTRVQQLLRDAEGLGWGTDHGTEIQMRWPSSFATEPVAKP